MERVTLLDVEAIHQQAGTRIDVRYLMFRKPSTSMIFRVDEVQVRISPVLVAFRKVANQLKREHVPSFGVLNSRNRITSKQHL
jgi:hypothetical protein